MKDGPGTVYLVGAGPGGPDLITVRGARLLARADAVVYDRLAARELLDLAPAGAELYNVGKDGERGHAVDQDAINELLGELARRRRTVVRLKGGDPFLFGRGGEEMAHLLRAGIPCEMVPGITSALAAPAAAGIPVTHRGMATSVTFVTGRETPAKPGSQTDWTALARLGGTIVSLMGVGRLPQIVGALVDGGRSPETPAALVRWGTRPHQQVITGTLADIEGRAREAALRPPAVLVVGEVVRLRSELGWFERRALFGRTILITRPRAQSGPLRDALTELGAEVIAAPLFRIVPAKDREPLVRAASELASYDWVFITSANGVEALFATLGEMGRDARAFGSARIVAVGPATAAALGRHGVRADIVPERFVAEGILESLGGVDLAGRKALVWQATGARDALANGLRRAGAAVDRVEAYGRVEEPIDPDVARRLAGGEIDVVVFASASAARGLCKALGDRAFRDLSQSVVYAAIGPATSDQLRRLGARVGVEAGEHTAEGVVAALADHLSG